jgi:two-component system cell cycle response regulator DivK
MSERRPTLVLLVDDVSDNTDMYAQYLEFEGYQVEVASNGDEGVKMARDLQPAVIVMDLSMPTLDGWAATRAIKADPTTRHIPVIVLTAHAMHGVAETAIAAGADAYFAKPYSPEELEAAIRSRAAVIAAPPVSSTSPPSAVGS